VRALGIDLGTKRIGVAVSDSAGTVATPIEVVARSGQRQRDHRRLLEIAAEWEVEVLVVGLPRSLSGELGPAARNVLGEVDALGAMTDLGVETYDERLTTVSADRVLLEQGLRAPQRRHVVDKVAAAVMLQAWLDGRRQRQAHEPD
jgi:putative Holliday junction resolvase